MNERAKVAVRYRLILLPVFPDSSEEAATHAATLAVATGATVAILGVIDTSAGFDFGAEGAAAYQRLRDETQAAIEAASRVVRGAGVPGVEHLVMDGMPGDAILEVAAEQGAEMIVLAARHAILHDTSARLVAQMLDRARCPVLIVPAERMPQ